MGILRYHPRCPRFGGGLGDLFLFRNGTSSLHPRIWSSGFRRILQDENFLFGIVFIPMFWIGLYGLRACLRPFRRYRSQDVVQVLWVSLLGSLAPFFVLILDDQIVTYTQYYQSMLVLYGAQVASVLAVRLPQTTRTAGGCTAAISRSTRWSWGAMSTPWR